MAISFSDCIECTLRDAWRARLLEAEHRFTQSQNDESRLEYLRILKIFSDLVLDGILPRENFVIQRSAADPHTGAYNASSPI
jgi:hypothetical protein